MYNDSINFNIDRKRSEQVEAMSTEYLSLLTILYGHFIRSGEKMIKHYHHLRMSDIETELQIRTIMVRGDISRKQRQIKEEHSAAEQQMLEELKRATG